MTGMYAAQYAEYYVTNASKEEIVPDVMALLNGKTMDG